MIYQTSRSSRPEVFCKKVFLKKFFKKVIFGNIGLFELYQKG